MRIFLPVDYIPMSNVSDPARKFHLDNLTWLRAIAAFFVVVSHSIRTSEAKYSLLDEKSYFLPINFLDLGSFGVCLFFALSGCTLYLSNKNYMGSVENILGFYLRRFMRIWPAFAISLVIYLCFIEIFKIGYIGGSGFWVALFLKDYSIFNVFQYLSLTFNISGPGVLFIPPYWSLPVEFQYYLLLPVAGYLMLKFKNAFFVPGVMAALLYFCFKYSVFSFDQSEVFKLGYTFFCGVMLAQARIKSKSMISFRIGGGVFFAIVFSVALVVNGFLVVPPNVKFVSDKMNYFGVASIICVALALFSAPPSLPAGLKLVLDEYGDVSYSIYLFHMLFLGFAAIAITRFGIYGNLTKLSFVLVFTLVSSFYFSKWTYRLIEIPSIELGKKWANNIKFKI